jgi:hypothetical protein
MIDEGDFRAFVVNLLNLTYASAWSCDADELRSDAKRSFWGQKLAAKRPIDENRLIFAWRPSRPRRPSRPTCFAERPGKYVQNGVQSRRFATGVFRRTETPSSPAGRVDGGLIFQRANVGGTFSPTDAVTAADRGKGAVRLECRRPSNLAGGAAIFWRVVGGFLGGVWVAFG